MPFYILSEVVNPPDACVDLSGFDKPTSLLRQLLESPDQDKPQKMTQETVDVLDSLMHLNPSDQRSNVATQERSATVKSSLYVVILYIISVSVYSLTILSA